ncbi:zinc finger protein 703-like [Asterias rubens]|uniref:zinc finger protein 703-like n=1 Tax=Asterias rubens TaxID=7604 RepID=UPI00145514B9|nr:zinc finger protein 703-like [Asterias rubens]
MLATRPLMHTEYLQPLDPLPTTLDAKKSPLALLAQTCSSIGKPDPPQSSNDVKPALAPIGRQSPTGKHSPEKASSVAGLPESSFKPYKQPDKRDGDALVIKIGYQGKDGKREVKSPLINSPHSPLLKAKSEPTTTPRSTPGSTEMGHSSLSESGHKDTLTNSKPTAPVQAAQVAPSHLHHSSYPGHYKHGLLPASHAGHCGCPSQVVGHMPYYPDPAVAARDPMSVHSPHKHEVNPLLAATASPYTAYARVKTADGGTTLMPICRDPYCTNCQSAQHYQTASHSGCTQCRHDTFALNTPFPIALPLPGSLSPYPLPSSVPSSAHPSQYLYPHPTTTTSQDHGHVCNWVSGATSCGKRFASSEELLQHLRTHTMTNSEVPTSAALSATLSAQLSAYYMQYPTAAAAAAAAAAGTFGLPKPGFPSPLSPVGAIRYHPYSKSPSPIAALPGLPTGAYYSPYALHDIKSRFATAGLPH